MLYIYRLSPVSMMRDTVRDHGIQGLYRGLPGIWIKDIPGSFIYFGSYEGSKSAMKYLNENPQLSKLNGNSSIYSCMRHGYINISTF